MIKLAVLCVGFLDLANPALVCKPSVRPLLSSSWAFGLMSDVYDKFDGPDRPKYPHGTRRRK